MHEQYDRIICDPTADAWEQVIRGNRDKLSVPRGLLTPEERAGLRRELLEAARNYTREVDTVMAGRKERSEDVSCTEEGPLLMTGHQPVIYHPGILYKNQLLQQYVHSRPGTCGINIIVDTDEGDGGRLFYPVLSHSVAIEHVTIAAGHGPYLFQRLADEKTVRAAFSEVSRSLTELGFTEPAARVERAADLYVQLAGHPVASANTAVRRFLQGRADYLEVPVSALLDMPEVQRYLGRLLSDAAGFVYHYNRILREYRTEHRIENLANPFPDMHVQGERIEFPCWVLDVKDEVRYPLYVTQTNEVTALYAAETCIATIQVDKLCAYAETLKPRYALAPRGPLLTMLLRLYCSDLFIHGIGGARYDRCTDMIIASYLGVPVPRYARASADAYLFREENRLYERQVETARKKRSLYFHPYNFFDSDEIAGETRIRLSSLWNKKSGLVEEMNNRGLTRRQRRSIAIRIRDVDREIRQLIDNEVETGPVTEPISQSEIRTYRFREFPFFFFE